MKSINKTTIEKLIILAFILLLAILVLSKAYRCPFRMITGIPCPCCGITRAIIASIHGDFAKSFYYHPLWWLIAINFLAVILSELKLIKLPRRLANAFLSISAALILICYFIRLLTHTLT